MRVIFLQDVPRVAKRHDLKEVNDGYAMNFLIPKKLAVPISLATLDMVRKMKEGSEKKKTEEEKAQNEKLAKRQEEHEALEKFRQEQQKELP